jgi:hypothetical protein
MFNLKLIPSLVQEEKFRRIDDGKLENETESDGVALKEESMICDRRLRSSEEVDDDDEKMSDAIFFL